MISHEQLDHWKALADAATPGPWYAPEDGEHIIDGSGDYLMTDNNCLAPERADFQFTAAAREVVPALIAEVEAQAKEIERLRAALTNIAAGGCASPEPCATHGKGALWCDACVARAALQETP